MRFLCIALFLAGMAGTGAAQVQNALARVDTVYEQIDSLISMPRSRYDSLRGNVRAYQDSLMQRMGFVGSIMRLPDVASVLPEAPSGWMPDLSKLPSDPALLLSKTGLALPPSDMGDLGRLKAVIDDPAAGGGDPVGMAKDHFSTRIRELEKGMAELDKFREKFERLDSLPELDLRFINTMRGKPMRERIIPGAWFRLVQRSGPVAEISPFLRYRLTGRFSLGAGWTSRFHVQDLSWVDIASGPMVTAVADLGRNYEVNLEYRWMSASLKGESVRFDNLFTGLRKVFRVTSSIRCFASVQYDLNRRSLQLTPGDRLQTRMGLEMSWKKIFKKY